MVDPSASPPSDGMPILERDETSLAREPSSPKAARKVALDLDDAPFLEDIQPVAKQSPAEKRPRHVADQPAAATGKPAEFPRVPVLIGGAALLILLAGLAFWINRPPPAPKSPPSLPAEAPAPTALAEDIIQSLDPFWVVYSQDETISFLTLKMSVVMREPALSLEIQRKMIILRDAVYSFLHNSPLVMLKRSDNVDALKTDLLSVMNQHLSVQLTDVLIEEYVVQ